MRAVWEKVWLRLVIVVLMLSVLVIGLVTRCCKMKVALPEGACYVVTVVKTVAESDTNVTVTLVYDSEGKLLRHQKGNELTDYTYDDQGRMLTSYGHDIKLDLPLKMIDYIYDEAGKLIKEEGYYMMEDYDTYYITYAYDGQGNLTNKKVYTDGELFREYVYSASGELLESLNYLHNSCQRYTFAKDGKLLQETRGTIDTPDNIMDYFYDGEGRLSKTEETYWRYDKKVKCTREYTYDNGGKLVRKNVYTSDSAAKYYDYTYDTAGNLLSYLYTQDGTTGGHRWEYDNRGRMTACHHLGKSESFSSHTSWKYDAEGNLVQWEQYGTVYTFSYTWPDGEVPQSVRDSVAAYVAKLAELDRHTVEDHISDHYNAMSSYRLP